MMEMFFYSMKLADIGQSLPCKELKGRDPEQDNGMG